MANNQTQCHTSDDCAKSIISALRDRWTDEITVKEFETLIVSLLDPLVHPVAKKERVASFVTWCHMTRSFVLSEQLKHRDNRNNRSDDVESSLD
jgi:hypothetical protein